MTSRHPLHTLAALAVAALVGACAGTGPATSAPGKSAYMIVGNDEKVTWDAAGKVRFLPPGKDTVQIYDIGRDPAAPKLVATLPIENSIFGPPTNLAVAPDQRHAFITNPMAWVQDGQAWKPSPYTKLNIIDLQRSPPSLVGSVTVGRQPSGMAISRDGKRGIVANRADQSISVLQIDGAQVRVTDTLPIGEPPVAASFSADGTRAFIVKINSNALGVVNFDAAGKPAYDKKNDITVGVAPYNMAVTPDGSLALALDMGNANASDGHVDTISVVDLKAQPPRVIDKVVVNDGPEGMAISPTGRHAAIVLIRGSNTDQKGWFYRSRGSVALLSIDGNKVAKVDEIDVGALPEGAVFSPDGKFLYIGNFLDSDISVLAVEGNRLRDTGRRIQTAGHPASMRAMAD